MQLAERLGLPLAYLAATDVAADRSVLDGARAVLSLGHGEYWSPERRSHVTAARDAGVNLAIFGARIAVIGGCGWSPGRWANTES